jgi:iron-sulfur cluster insertion protein
MIKLTDNAIDRLSYLAEKNDSKYVRLSVKGGGCAGYEYEWSFDNNDTREDVLLKDILLVHRDFELYLMGTTLDWVEDTFKSEFVISNPMAKSSCGCGESFSV